MKNLIFISAFTFLFNWTATAAGHTEVTED